MKMKNIFLPLLAATIVPAIFLTLISSIWDAGFRGWSVIIFPFILLTTFLHTIILGMPTILLLQRFNMLRFGTIVLAGFIIGGFPIIAGGIVATWLRGEIFNDWLAILKAIGSCGILGIIGSIAFWIVFNHLKKCK